MNPESEPQRPDRVSFDESSLSFGDRPVDPEEVPPSASPAWPEESSLAGEFTVNWTATRDPEPSSSPWIEFAPAFQAPRRPSGLWIHPSTPKPLS